MISPWLFAACVTVQIFGAALVIEHTPFLKRKPRRTGSLAAQIMFGVPEVVEDEVRPAVRYLGIALMVAGGAVAGWVLRTAEDQARPKEAIHSGILVPEPEPCRDTVVDGNLPLCPDLRQRVAWVARSQFGCDCVREDSL